MGRRRGIPRTVRHKNPRSSNPMKPTKTQSALIACTAALLLPLSAFADSDKLEKMDADGDGKISRSEHSAGTHKMFTEMDANGDGVVTVAEMDAKHNKSEMHSDPKKGPGTVPAGDKHADKFKTFDKDGDGRLTSSEFASGCDAMFEKKDTNRDGFLSKDECDQKTDKKDKTY